MSSDGIGVLGSGDVGRALGRGFADRGWDVVAGTRRRARLDGWVAETPGTVAVGSFAAAHGEVAVLAVRGAAAMDVLEAAGHRSFDGTLLLDTTNPLDVSDDGPPGLRLGGTDSLGERIQAALAGAAVVRCFNTVSDRQMVDPAFEADTPRMYVCGDDAAAKERTEDIPIDFGRPGALDVGDVTAARYLEAMVTLWVRVGGVLATWGHMLAPVREPGRRRPEPIGSLEGRTAASSRGRTVLAADSIRAVDRRGRRNRNGSGLPVDGQGSRAVHRSLPVDVTRFTPPVLRPVRAA